MVAVRAALLLFFLTVAGIAQAAQPDAQRPRDGATAALPPARGQNLGYDAHGRLVPQPRLAVNLFALSGEAAGPSRTELKAFGKWMADVVRMFADLDAHGGDDVARLAGLRKQSPKQKAALSGQVERLEDNERQIDSLIQQLKGLKAPRSANPDLARAYSVTARDAAQVAALFEKMRTAVKSTVEAGMDKDLAELRAGILDELSAAIALAKWSSASTGRQLSAAVGGTPDLWLWQSQIEGAQAMEALVADIRHVLEKGALPPPAGRAKIEHSLAAIGEWNRRGAIQVRHELSRAQSSLEPSMTRARWLEQVYSNYERTFQVERAFHGWLATNLPKFYDQLSRAAVSKQGRAAIDDWQQYQALNAREWVLLIERYELLAAMP